MNNKQQAKLTRNTSLIAFLIANLAIYKDNVGFMLLYNKLVTDCDDATASAVEASADNSGYCADKVAAKSIVAQSAAMLSGNAQVQFDKLNNKTLSRSLHSGVNYYFKAADALCIARLQNAHDLMDNNITIITENYVTPAQLTDYQTKIDSFSNFVGQSATVNTTSPVNTAKFASDLKVTDTDIVDAKKLVKQFKISHPVFYAGTIANCKIPPINIHHNLLNFIIFNSITKEVMPNVSGELDKKPNELLHSDKAGLISFVEVKAGKGIGKFKMPSFVPQEVDYAIEVGKAITINVFMLPLIEPDVAAL